MRGKAGVANARLAYQAHQEVFSTPRWGSLADAGAHPQRPLWASTGVKDPAYPDTMYVTELVAPGTVNTMPEKTLDATADHAEVTRRHGDAVLRRGRRGPRQPRAARDLVRRGHRPARTRGRREVREVVGGAARTGSPESSRRPPRELARRRCHGGGRGCRGRARAHPRRRPRREPAVRAGPHPVGRGRRGGVGQAPRVDRPAATSRHLVGEVAALRGELKQAGYDRVVLCGMGGSSLAPRSSVRRPACPRRARLLRPRRRPWCPDRPRPDRRRRVEQVGLDRRDRQPAARLRAGLP